MMYDEISIIIVLLALYMIECIIWIPVGSVAFIHGNKGWYPVDPSEIFGNKKGGFIFINPLSLLVPTYAIRPDRHNQNKDSFSLAKAKKRIRRFIQISRPLILSCRIIQIYILILIPILLLTFGLQRSLIPLGIILYLMAIAVSAIFSHTHKKLYPMNKEERISSMVGMILCPPTAVKAPTILSLRLLAGFNPVTISRILCGKDDTHSLARKLLLEPEDFILGRKRITKSMKRVEALDIKASELLIPPTVKDESSHTYCPRCHGQYEVLEGICNDCSSIALISFKSKI